MHCRGEVLTPILEKGASSAVRKLKLLHQPWSGAVERVILCRGSDTFLTSLFVEMLAGQYDGCGFPCTMIRGIFQ